MDFDRRGRGGPAVARGQLRGRDAVHRDVPDRVLRLIGMRALVITALVAGSAVAGCTSPIVPAADAGTDAFTPPPVDSGVDAFVPADAGSTDASVDTGPVDVDAGTDAGMPGALEVVGGFGTASPSTTTSGTLTVVGQGFGVVTPMCAGALCVVGGFSR